MPLILNIVLLPEWSTAVFFCLVIVVHESLVCPEQLNCLLFFRKILQVPQILRFSSIFVYLNPFQQSLYDFEINLFTLRTTEGLICNYHRRFKHSLMLQKEKTYIKSRGWKRFEFKDQGKFNFLSSGKHISSFWRTVLNGKNMIFRQNKKKRNTSSLCLKVFTRHMHGEVF